MQVGVTHGFLALPVGDPALTSVRHTRDSDFQQLRAEALQVRLVNRAVVQLAIHLAFDLSLDRFQRFHGLLNHGSFYILSVV